MSAIAERVSGVRVGEPRSHLNLTLFPLLADGPESPGYRLLDEALADGCARVTEVSESGSVPELKFVNDCDRPVLLLDGEELVGAKQNRILNLTVLVPARATVIIPVSCVEAGRWHAESAEFASAPRAHYSAGRARKAAQVSASLRSAGSRRSDQADVWADISAKASRMAVDSDTEAAAAMYDTHRGHLDAYVQAFAPGEAQAGALFAVNGEVLGLDLFDSVHTLAALLPKLVRSYALDAIDGARAEYKPATPEAAQQLLQESARATVEQFPAVGEGEDLRLRGERLAGGALVKDDRLVHLCAFRVPADTGDGDERDGRLARASLRRRARLWG